MTQEGKRHLAAIVFTDAVGFSALANRDEEKALSLMSADVVAIREATEGFGGQVLKSTGDGLMLRFDSAVAAVECAQAIQRLFAARHEALTGEDHLQHRIGIHLGDVLVTGDDIMGDGVNIAARLQQSAQPGGICISQTVYDVVKSRIVPLNVVPRGARQLKNIQEPVMLYDIGPVGSQAPRSSSRPASRGGRLLKVAAVITVVLAVLLVMGRVARKNRQVTGKTPAATVTGPNAAASMPEEKKPGSAQPARSTPSPAPETPKTGAAGQGPVVAEGHRYTSFREAYAAFMPDYRFDEFLAWLRANQPDDIPAAKRNMENRLAQLSAFKAWVTGSLARHSAGTPLIVRTPQGKVMAWSAEPGVVTFSKDGQHGSKPVSSLEPREIYGLSLYLAREAGKSAGALERLGRIELFRTEYGLPAIREAAKRLKPGRPAR